MNVMPVPVPTVAGFVPDQSMYRACRVVLPGATITGGETVTTAEAQGNSL